MPHLPLLLSLLAVVIAGATVYHRALAYFFSQDDFIGLGRAAGQVARIHGPWRWLGNQAIFDLMRPLAGLSATPYHLASLVVHLTCGALILIWLARRFSPAAATLAGIYFVTHPTLFTGVYWISVIADSLALAFAIGALLALDTPDRRRWLAVPLFALSLLAKESTLLLPLAAAFIVRPRPGDEPTKRPWRDPVLAGMAAVSVAYVIYFATSAYGTYFVSPQADGGSPEERAAAAYAVGIGPHVLANLSSYLGWTANPWFPTVRSFSDAVDPNALPWALAITAAWLAGLAVPALRNRGWLAGGALYLLLLLPVLPLRHHTYHYYLYAPLLGAAWCVAALFDALFDARRARAPVARPAKRAAAAVDPAPGGERRRWLVAAGLAGLLTANGYALVERIETYPFIRPELRSDPIIDRARIAAQAHQSLSQAALPRGCRLAFWSPIAAAEAATASADSESYLEKNVRSALVGGLAVRLLFPDVREVAFVHVFRPLPDPWLYAVYLPDGQLHVATSTELDSVLKIYAARGAR